MNSRERVKAAAHREKPDRPATSLRCTPEVWAKLRSYLNVDTNEDVLDILDIDMLGEPPFYRAKGEICHSAFRGRHGYLGLSYPENHK